MKLWLLQPGIAPYRIPLFERIARTPGIDLTVALLCRQVRGQSWKVSLDDLPFKVLPVYGFNLNHADDLQTNLAIPLIWHLIKARPDVIICSGFTFSTLLTYFVSRFTGLPYVIWNEGTEYTDGRISRIKLWLRRVMGRRASAFIVAGTLSQQYIERMLGGRSSARFFLSYNCVDNAQFMGKLDPDTFVRERTALRARFPKRNILFVGRLVELKGVIQLMEAYRELVETHGMRDLGLILLGEGALRMQLEKYAETHNLENVFIEGFVHRERIHYYYSIADVFVLLSRQDANPLVIFEALAAGVPIVCSRRAGNAIDFIKEGENGYVVEPNDHEQVVRGVRSSLNDLDRECARAYSLSVVAKANYEDSARAFLEAVQAVSKTLVQESRTL